MWEVTDNEKEGGLFLQCEAGLLEEDEGGVCVCDIPPHPDLLGQFLGH